MPEQSNSKQKGKQKGKEKPEVVKKVVTAEQADAFKNVVNQIAQAAHSEETPKEPEGKTEILNAVLDSLPEPQLVQKPKRRRVTSAARAPQSSDSSENSEQ
jgi:ribonuclease E